MRSSITTQKHKTKPLYRILAVAFWLILWQAAAMLVGQDILLASPIAVVKLFFELAATAGFWQAVVFSLARIMGGFFIGILAAIVLAALSARHEWVRILLEPLNAAIRSIPVASFVIVALIWLSIENLSILISFLVVYPMIYANVFSEIRRADEKMLEMAQVFRLSRTKTILYAYILPAMKGFEGACCTAMGLAWKSGVAAELITIPSGSIGEMLYDAKVLFLTADKFAWTLAIVLLSSACVYMIRLALRALAAGIERM